MLFSANVKVLKIGGKTKKGLGSRSLVLTKPLKLIDAYDDSEVSVSVKDGMIKIKKAAV